MMTAGAAELPMTACPGSLLQNRRLLGAYQFIWLALAVTASAVLLRLLADPGMQPAILLLRLVKAAALITVSVILFRRRKGDIVAAMLSLAFLLWTVTSSFDFSADLVWPAALDRLRFLLFALALLLFPTGEWKPAWTRKVAIASGLVFVIGMAETLGILPTKIFLPLAIGCVLAALSALLLRYRVLSVSTEKQQLKWVAFGLVVGISLILTARAGAAASASLPPIALEALFQSGIIILALGFLVSLLRYRLYDAESVISRSAAYAGLTLALVATFTASEVFIEGLGQNYLGAEIGNLAGALAAGIAAMLLAPLHDRISKWAEGRFQRDLATLKVNLPELLAELSGTSSAARIAQCALPRLEEALHAIRLAMIVDGRVIAAWGIDTRSVRECMRGKLAMDCGQEFEHCPGAEFPLRMPLRCPFGSLRGWLLVGPRPDGSTYSRDELEALAAVAKPLRIALFAAREREKEKCRELAMRRSAQRALKALAGRVSRLEGAFTPTEESVLIQMNQANAAQQCTRVRQLAVIKRK